MLSHLTLASAIAAELRDADLLQATVYAEGDTDPEGTPALGVVIEEARSVHASLHGGLLTFKYRFDADATTLTEAATDLGQAVDHLLSETGRAHLREDLPPLGIWLRILGPRSTPSVVTIGDRKKAVEIRMPYWIQTAV